LTGALAAVDWPSAAAGAPWFDQVAMVPSMALEGAGTPEELLRASRHARAADSGRVNAVLAAIAGYFLYSCLQPPPPGIPHLRACPRGQGRVCTRWLRRRLEEAG